MSAEPKFLKFVGVDKKEQVLLKSFLNLAKDELEYDLQIDENHVSPDVVVMDEEHVEAGDSFAATVLKITIGNNSDNPSDSYIHRPLQWSRFKNVLDQLENIQNQQPIENKQQSIKQELPVKQEPSDEKKPLDKKKPPVESPAKQQVEKVVERVVEKEAQKVKEVEKVAVEQAPPQEPKVQPAPVAQTQQSTVQKQVQAPVEEPLEQEVVEVFPDKQEEEEAQFSENVGEWELEVSVQNEAAKESAAAKVVPEDELGQLYALNDDSIESPSEFLDNLEEMVIETDKVDQWDEKSISVSVDVSESQNSASGETSEISELNKLLDQDKSKVGKLLGEPLGKVVEFWSGDTEILLNNHPVFVIRAKRGAVYTEYEPHKWYKIFSSGGMRQRKLDNKWKPYGRMENYPLNWLSWCAYITRSNGVLSDDINKKDLFRLERWPDFSLIQNDNNLLKLCSLAFVSPESPRSLVMQSKLRARVIVGFINACHIMGLLSKHGNEDGGETNQDNTASSMTWFKDLFK